MMLLKLSRLTLLGLALLSAAYAAEAKGGVFIPRNGCYEGVVGKAHMLVNSTQGGVYELVSGQWPDVEPLVRVGIRLRIRATGFPGLPPEGEDLLVKQEFDRNPDIIFLEEGRERIGLRVRFKLFDERGNYHGLAIQETWLYPTGELYCNVGASLEDRLAHTEITAAYQEFEFAPGFEKALVGAPGADTVDLKRLDGEWSVALEAPELAERFIALQGGAVPSVALFWNPGVGNNTFVGRDKGRAPVYWRWPAFFPQAFTNTTWNISGDNSRLAIVPTEGGTSLQMRWVDGVAKPTPEGRFRVGAYYRLALGDDLSDLYTLAVAERNPVVPEVTGGVPHGSESGYNLEGIYEIRKTDNPMIAQFPADPAARVARIRVISLQGNGAVVAELDGQRIVPQLVSTGGIADDPLAPMTEQPNAPATEAVITVPLLPDRPRVLEVTEQPGIQLVYQTRDRTRSYLSFSTQGGVHAGMEFSLVDGRARRIRAYGRPEWALGENLMHWFSFCGFTPLDMLNQLRDFEVLENGPERVVFRYVSSNYADRAQSEYVVTLPYDSPAMQMQVKATFTVTQDWPYETNQFFDVFPFRGVWPSDWWYQRVLWAAAGGRTHWIDTVDWSANPAPNPLQDLDEPGFFALFPSDRGNMVLLTKNFDPPTTTQNVICGNYIDFHMDMHLADLAPGRRYSMEYDLAIVGDENTTQEELAEMGERSLELGKLALPEG